MEIIEACSKSECEFDLESVKAFLELPKRPKFEIYLKKDRMRVELYYNVRF
jgi:hypothetical protein